MTDDDVAARSRAIFERLRAGEASGERSATEGPGGAPDADERAPDAPADRAEHEAPTGPAAQDAEQHPRADE